MTDPNNLQKLIREHTRRLDQLKLRQARQGSNTDPHITLEIEDIEAEVARLQAQLTGDPTAATPSSPPASSGVSIGNVSGGIHNSTIAGRDVVGPTTTLSGSGNVFIQGSTIYAGERSVIGAAAGGSINTGDTASGLEGSTLADLFAPLYKRIQANTALPDSDKADVTAEVKELEQDATAKAEAGAEPDESFLRRRLRSIEQMAPDIIDTIATTAANPVAGIKGVWDKIVAKAREIKAARKS
ncbi:MAG: hypothetical protein KJ077_27250 [Anaerolineae bacterium]|nr:hypothetical protein [Anaerolineae bacterium]